MEPKLEVFSLADFPVLNPSSQGEIGCMLARTSPAQAETADVVAYLKDQDPILCSSMQILIVSIIFCSLFIEIADTCRKRLIGFLQMM